jgi:hypothetical protein
MSRSPYDAPAVFGDRKMRSSRGEIYRRLWSSTEPEPFFFPTRPTGWVSWEAPPDPLPIDELITKLIRGKVRGRNKVISLRNADTLGGHCPYEIARCSAIHALSMACREQRKSEGIINEVRPSLMNGARQPLRELENIQLADLATHLKKICRLASLRVAHNQLLEPDTSEITASVRVAELLAELSNILPFAIGEVDNLHNEYAQGVGDVWRIEFVSRLGDAWVQLVGDMPTVQGAFAEFVEAVWNSLEDPAPEEWKWDSQIRTAKKHNGMRWKKLQTDPPSNSAGVRP